MNHKQLQDLCITIYVQRRWEQWNVEEEEGSSGTSDESGSQKIDKKQSLEIVDGQFKKAS